MTRRKALPRVEPTEEKVIRRAAGQWELKVHWSFRNQDEREVYFAVGIPLLIDVGREITLDHSAPRGGRLEQVNTDLGFELFSILPGQTKTRWLTYSVALSAPRRLSLVGRFGYSYTAPDPAWARTKNWKAVARWQQLLETAPVPISFAE